MQQRRFWRGRQQRSLVISDTVRRYGDDPVRLLGRVGLVFVVLVWLWQLPHFLAGNSTVWPQYATAFSDMLWYTAWGFAVLLLVTAVTRTVPLKTVLGFWFLGVFAVHAIVIFVGVPFRETLGVDGVGIWVSPITETVVVGLVVLLFYAVVTYRRTTHPTVSDGLLVGFATGAGLGFHEEMTYARLFPIGPGAEYASVGNAGQDIWWSYVFPLIGWQSTFNIRQFGNGATGHFTLYHAGWGALLGVGIGLAFVHRHHILGWLMVPLAVAITYFEHMSANWKIYQSLEPAPIVGELFQAGDVHGVSELAVYVLLVAIAGGILADLVVLRRTARSLDAVPAVQVRPLAGNLRSKQFRMTLDGPVAMVRTFRTVDTYARFRRAFLIAIYRNRHERRSPEALEGPLAWLDSTGRRAGLFAWIGVSGAAIGAVIAASAVSDLPPLAGIETGPLLSSASSAPPHRFMEPLASALGSVAAVIAAFVGLLREPRHAISDSPRQEDSAADTRAFLGAARAVSGTIETEFYWQDISLYKRDAPVTWTVSTGEERLPVDHLSIAYDDATGEPRLFAHINEERYPLHEDAHVTVLTPSTDVIRVYPAAVIDQDATIKDERVAARKAYDHAMANLDDIGALSSEEMNMASRGVEQTSRDRADAGNEAMQESKSVILEGAKAAVFRTGDPRKVSDWLNSMKKTRDKYTEGRERSEKK